MLQGLQGKLLKPALAARHSDLISGLARGRSTQPLRALRNLQNSVQDKLPQSDLRVSAHKIQHLQWQVPGLLPHVETRSRFVADRLGRQAISIVWNQQA